MEILAARRGVAAALFCLIVYGGRDATAAGKQDWVATLPQPCPGVVYRVNWIAPVEPVPADRHIRAGGFIKTGSQGCSLRLTDGTAIDLLPESSVQLHAPTEVNLEVGATTIVGRADLKSGSFRVSVPPTGRPLFSVITKGVMAAFKPGKGTAKVLPDSLIVTMEEGSAKVATGGKWTAMGSGQYMNVRFKGGQPTPQGLPAPPAFAQEPCHANADHPCAIAVVVGDERGRVAARWSPAGPGINYAIELLRGNPEAEAIDRRELGSDQPWYVSDPLPVGSYWIALRARNQDGVLGPRATRPLRVVRLLPDLGVNWLQQQQAVVLPQGRAARVDGSAGLRVAWSGLGFVAAPANLAFVGQEVRRVVSLRIDGDPTDDVALTLEPYSVRADVEMTPNTARWPQDRVKVVVRLSDPTRRVDPQSVYPKFRATINSMPIQAGLVKRGDTWHADIPPRSGSGPWAIRVEVLDADDNVLGRGLLNVEGRQTRSPSQW